ncbi:hypothetical protein B4102_3677 [Heyndrickxia sporothermodurans]|uniref:Uncharacterized protein n=1 Tax=Heyndrickxia sporothermodurans TaxID=46224 RepID=A0A150KNV6_9BACI|nr:hypothetical protein B4102_3677 [Heyndrickxia sporothermodurans]
MKNLCVSGLSLYIFVLLLVKSIRNPGFLIHFCPFSCKVFMHPALSYTFWPSLL